MTKAELRLLASIEKKLVRVRDKIATNRDELRRLVEDYTAVLESADDAADHIGYAIDAISQYA